MFGRTKLRIYLKSGAVVKVRVHWKQKVNTFTGEFTEAEWTAIRGSNRRLFHIHLQQIDAIVVSRW